MDRVELFHRYMYHFFNGAKITANMLTTAIYIDGKEKGNYIELENGHTPSTEIRISQKMATELTIATGMIGEELEEILANLLSNMFLVYQDYMFFYL